MMPGMSGTDALKIIRDERIAEGTPVIALTADAIVGAKDAYIKEGFTDYLSKPVMYPELEEILMKSLDSSLILTKEQIDEQGDPDGSDKPTVLVISDSAENLKVFKEIMSDRCKGGFVKDEESARRYLKKHTVAYILKDGREISEKSLSEM
jgi:CheY-like chemotaxis protein